MNELKSLIFTESKKEFEKCFWPKLNCSQPPIRAHSIQNSQILDELAHKNYVIMLVPKQNLTTEPQIEFKLVGRNQATTFTGLCSDHDKELFLPIDTEQFDPNNEEQKFLIAYRSILREFHTRCKVAKNQQNIDIQSINLGVSNPTDLNQAFQIDAYELYKYKTIYDNIYNKNLFTEIQHDLIQIENRNSPLAVSSIIEPKNNINSPSNKSDPKFIVLNVFPFKQGIMIIFSYLKSQKNTLKYFTDEIINSHDEYQLYLLSKTILRNCENFVISPIHFKNFSEHKKQIIIDFYYQTVVHANQNIDYEFDSEELILF